MPVKFHCSADAYPKLKKKKTPNKQTKRMVMIIHNTVITVRENKVEQGEATVFAHAHMFESRDA